MIDKIMRIFWWICDIPWRIRCRFKYRHYMIPLRGFGKWSWHEDDERLVHGMMEVLRHYVEDQEPWDVHMVLDGKVADLMNQVNDQENIQAKEMFRSQVDDAIVLARIYRWWKEDRPSSERAIEDLYDKWREMRGELKFTEISKDNDPEAAEEKLNKQTTEMLCKLVELRGRLWT